jgi:hypothetical protein
MNDCSVVHVCDVAVDVDTFAISSTHLIVMIQPGEDIYCRADQLHTAGIIGRSHSPLITGYLRRAPRRLF